MTELEEVLSVMDEFKQQIGMAQAIEILKLREMRMQNERLDAIEDRLRRIEQSIDEQ